MSTGRQDQQREGALLDDGWTSADVDVADRALHKSRLLSRRCSSCVFRSEQAGRIQGIDNERVRDLVDGARAAESYVVCHATLGTSAPAICRGFYDAYSTNALRIMQRLWGFVEVEPAPDEGTHRD